MLLRTETDWLNSYPALKNLDDGQWREAVEKMEVINVPANTVVFRPGDACANLLFLTNGRLRVSMSGDNGREIVLYHLTGGDVCIFTLTTLLKASDYSATAITETPCRAARLPIADFRELFATSRGFQDFILSTMATRMHDTLLLLQEVTFNRLEMRLACFLSRHARSSGGYAIEMTHQQIAFELGTTREMISRILKDMERRGCLQLKRKRIELADMHKLGEMSAGMGETV